MLRSALGSGDGGQGSDCLVYNIDFRMRKRETSTMATCTTRDSISIRDMSNPSFTRRYICYRVITVSPRLKIVRDRDQNGMLCIGTKNIKR